ncbi:MAG: hypothetical protein NVS2B7_22410 [Herpetosiphon sp.]
MNDPHPTSSPSLTPDSRVHRERVQAIAQKHWLGRGATPEQQAVVDEIRLQYFLTAKEYYKSSHALYEGLQVQNQRLDAHKTPFAVGNRNVQLFLAYSILWEAFNHLYTAAAYTHFAQHGPDRAPLEDERSRITRVLSTPILSDADWQKITTLRNGESANKAISRMVNRSSRELHDIYGKKYDHTLTNMDAFLQGVVDVTSHQRADGTWEQASQAETWTVQALDEAGEPIDPDSPYTPQKYRSVVQWHCFQIRNNLNFIGRSEGSVDDAILIIRAFCLVDPLVGLLLHDSRKATIFAL